MVMNTSPPRRLWDYVRDGQKRDWPRRSPPIISFINRNAILAGGIGRISTCLPVGQRERHRVALAEAAVVRGTGGSFWAPTRRALYGRRKAGRPAAARASSPAPVTMSCLAGGLRGVAGHAQAARGLRLAERAPVLWALRPTRNGFHVVRARPLAAARAVGNDEGRLTGLRSGLSSALALGTLSRGTGIDRGQDFRQGARSRGDGGTAAREWRLCISTRSEPYTHASGQRGADLYRLPQG